MPQPKTGSLCPAIKAADIIGDKWTLLILREFFFGARRYSEFQSALPRISPTILSKRLKELETNNLIIKRGNEYRLTRSGKELAPMIDHMSKWGLRWARRRLRDEDIDAAAFMWDFHRTLVTSELPDGRTIFSVTLSDQTDYAKWWLIATEETVDLCTEDPGMDVDLYIVGNLPDLAAVWMGDKDIKQAQDEDCLMMTGQTYLTKSAAHWFPKSAYADVRPERELS